MKSIPSCVQLPGGIKLTGVRFKAVEFNDDGSRKLFEIQPPDAPPMADGWVLFANEDEIRKPRVP